MGGRPLARAAAGADLIAISGDLFDRDTHLEQVIPAIRSLCRMAPVYYVSGNHEWTVEGPPGGLSSNGGKLGPSSWITAGSLLERQGRPLPWQAFRTPTGRQTKPRQNLSLPGCLRTGLPFSFTTGTQSPRFGGPLGADLILSGHGHGGLVRLPLVGGLADAGQGPLPPV